MFTELVKQHIQPLLVKSGLRLFEETDEMIAYSSNSRFFRFAFNSSERLPYFYVGADESETTLLDDHLLNSVFGSDRKIDQVPLLDFVQNVADFLEKEGEGLLNGEGIIRLIRYQEKRAEEYTAKIRQKQFRSLID